MSFRFFGSVRQKRTNNIKVTEANQLLCRNIPQHSDLSLSNETYPQICGIPIAPRSVDFFCKRYADELQILIRQMPLSDGQLDVLLMPLINRLISYVNVLPASEFHHHSGPGGLFHHSLQCASNLVSMAQNQVFEGKANPESRYHSQQAWILGAAVLGLSHDMGKIFDMDVMAGSENLWNPLKESLNTWVSREKIKQFFVIWKKDREHKKHELRSLRLMYLKLIPQAFERYLAETRKIEVFDAIDQAILFGTGPYATLLKKAEAISIEDDFKKRKALGAQFTQGSSPLLLPLITAIQSLLNTGRWTVNTSQSPLFMTTQGLFLSLNSQTAQDIHHAACQLQASYVPASIEGLCRVFNEVGLLEANNGKDLFWAIQLSQPSGQFCSLIKIKSSFAVFILDSIKDIKPVEVSAIGFDKKDPNEDETKPQNLKDRLIAPKSNFDLSELRPTKSPSKISLDTEEDIVLINKREFCEVLDTPLAIDEVKKLMKRCVLTIQSQLKEGDGFFIENLSISEGGCRTCSSLEVERFLRNHQIGEKVQEIMFRLYRDISSVEFDQAHHRLVLKAEEYEKSK